MRNYAHEQANVVEPYDKGSPLQMFFSKQFVTDWLDVCLASPYP
jgi:hypothetical protein